MRLRTAFLLFLSACCRTSTAETTTSPTFGATGKEAARAENPALPPPALSVLPKRHPAGFGVEGAPPFHVTLPTSPAVLPGEGVVPPGPALVVDATEDIVQAPVAEQADVFLASHATAAPGDVKGTRVANGPSPQDILRSDRYAEGGGAVASGPTEAHLAGVGSSPVGPDIPCSPRTRATYKRLQRVVAFKAGRQLRDDEEEEVDDSANYKTLRRLAAFKAGRHLSMDEEVEVDDSDLATAFPGCLSQEAITEKPRDDEVVIGTKISEDHNNYVMMYNMLTGIRVEVSRCQAKPQRDLTPADFTATHNVAFDTTGSELTPSAKYDFKFKDYAPWVFRNLREYFKIDAADYLVSLTSKHVLSELGSPGKSGSFFYYSADYRFIIKTIHHGEHKFLRRILPQYYEHVRRNPNTLLSRFLGLHRIQLPQGREVHFVVMANVFPPNRDIHETYDLKGSTVGRSACKVDRETNPRCVMKDLDWLEQGRRLELGPVKQAILAEQLGKDVALLSSLNIMDYSLLVGIHYLERGNGENIRDNTLSVFDPSEGRQPENVRGGGGAATGVGLEGPGAVAGSEVEDGLAGSNPVTLGRSESTRLHERADTFTERKQSVFYQDDGGFLSTDDRDRPGNILYYIGVIDILTSYNTRKKVEHLWKSFSADKTQISAVKPELYGKRFMDFMVKPTQTS